MENATPIDHRFLHEMPNVRQNEGEHFRRWFLSEECDLTVWFEGKMIVMFQFSYDNNQQEKAVTWKIRQNLKHNLVSGNDHSPTKNEAAILTNLSSVNKDYIIRKFQVQAKNIEFAIGDFILNVLTDNKA